MRVPVVFALLLSTSLASAAVEWNESFVETQVAARKSGKPILALFWAEW